ncbi:hypothetical protein CHS0354_007521 [Potamilus streckersoni]|uniref:Uncharacterized protein n=1 Tax=Potamilus streckersoni TaxID=2493646 RepID=A0AAE0T915_9BIVA|nr:hypothetical protein CHS0354_007521 [Potamilus streckersoni]
MDENVVASGDDMEIVTVEDPLQCAFMKSLQTGSVMVKEELKLKIQIRRLSEEGKNSGLSLHPHQILQIYDYTDGKRKMKKINERNS